MLSITGNEVESIFTEYTCTQFIKMFRQQVLGGNRHWLEKYNTVMAVTLHCCYIITHIVKNKSLNYFFLFQIQCFHTINEMGETYEVNVWKCPPQELEGSPVGPWTSLLIFKLFGCVRNQYLGCEKKFSCIRINHLVILYRPNVWQIIHIYFPLENFKTEESRWVRMSDTQTWSMQI